MNQNVVQSVLGVDVNTYSDAHLHKFIIVGTGVTINKPHSFSEEHTQNLKK